jgi:hypothetical protein
LEKLGTQILSQDDLDLITITSQNTSFVEFTVNHDFAGTVSVVSVHYYESEAVVDCDVNKNVVRSTVLSYAAFCVDGIADVSIYIQPVGQPVDECLSCKAPGDTGSAVNAYYYALPCVPVCVPGVNAVSGSSTPATSTTAPHGVPDLACYTGAMDTTPAGGNKCPVSMNPIEIAFMNREVVKFKLKNVFTASPACTSSDMTIRFERAGMSGSTCNPPIVMRFGSLSTVMYEAKCNDGFAEVEIFASCASGSGGPLNAQSVLNACGRKSECSHRYVVPCNPDDMCVTSSPVAAGALVPPTAPTSGTTTCTSRLVSIVASEGTKYNWPAGALSFLDPACGDGTLRFNVTQKWKDDTVSWWNMMPDSNRDGIWDSCVKNETIQPNAPARYEVLCPAGGGEFKVQITLHDGSFKNSSNDNNSGGVCGGWPNGDGILVYTLTFSCDNVVPGMRRLDISATTVSPVAVTNDEPMTEGEDLPYCLSEDFPCEGDESNMVYVCHYSARKGYQTFCVPETDSDILRFYANDYCGPCEGGRGATWGKPAING